MNEQVSKLFANLTARGLTDTAAGVILGATLQQTPPATQQYKQDVFAALLIMQRRQELKREAELREIVALLGLTESETQAAAEQAAQAIGAQTNG